MREKSDGKINIPLCLFLGITISLTWKIFVFDIYRVKGFSMESAIKDGQSVVVSKISYGLQNPFKTELLFCWNEPKAGDAILYMYQNYWVVKRCVAAAGTELRFEDEGENYFLLVGEKRIPLTSIQFHKLRTTKAVPKGYVMAVGDNYALSHDSRDYGFVPVKNVTARVICK